MLVSFALSMVIMYAITTKLLKLITLPEKSTKDTSLSSLILKLQRPSKPN